MAGGVWARATVSWFVAGVFVLALPEAGAGRAAPAAVPDDAVARDTLARLSEAWRGLDGVDLAGFAVTSDRFTGRVVVLDFWATWCAPCLAEIPWLRRLRDDFGADRVEVVGVNLDVAERRRLVAWLNRQRVDWPQLHDGRGYGGAVARAFEVTSLPTLVVIDGRGRVVATGLRGERLYRTVEQLVSARPRASAPLRSSSLRVCVSASLR